MQRLGQGFAPNVRQEPAQARPLLHVILACARRGVRGSSPEAVRLRSRRHSVLFSLTQAFGRRVERSDLLAPDVEKPCADDKRSILGEALCEETEAKSLPLVLLWS